MIKNMASPAARKVAREIGLDLDLVASATPGSLVQLEDVLKTAQEQGIDIQSYLSRPKPETAKAQTEIDSIAQMQAEKEASAAFAIQTSIPVPNVTKPQPAIIPAPINVIRETPPAPPIQQEKDDKPLFDYDYIENVNLFESMLDEVEQKSKEEANVNPNTITELKDKIARDVVSDEDFERNLSVIIEDELSDMGSSTSGDGEDKPSQGDSIKLGEDGFGFTQSSGKPGEEPEENDGEDEDGQIVDTVFVEAAIQEMDDIVDDNAESLDIILDIAPDDLQIDITEEVEGHSSEDAMVLSDDDIFDIIDGQLEQEALGQEALPEEEPEEEAKPVLDFGSFRFGRFDETIVGKHTEDTEPPKPEDINALDDIIMDSIIEDEEDGGEDDGEDVEGAGNEEETAADDVVVPETKEEEPAGKDDAHGDGSIAQDQDSGQGKAVEEGANGKPVAQAPAPSKFWHDIATLPLRDEIIADRDKFQAAAEPQNSDASGDIEDSEVIDAVVEETRSEVFEYPSQKAPVRNKGMQNYTVLKDENTQEPLPQYSGQIAAFEYDPAMFDYDTQVSAKPLMAARIKVEDSAVIDLLAQFKIGYRIGIIKTIIKACSFALDKISLPNANTIGVVDAHENFDVYVVDDIQNSSIQQMMFSSVANIDTSKVLVSVWDLISCRLESFSASNIDGINIFVHHNDSVLLLELASQERLLDPFKAIQFMETVRDFLERPNRYL